MRYSWEIQLYYHRSGFRLLLTVPAYSPALSMCSTHHFLYFGSIYPGGVLDPLLDCRDSLFLGVIPGAFWSLFFCSWLKCLSAFLDDDCCLFWSVEEGIFDLSLCLALLVLLIDIMCFVSAFAGVSRQMGSSRCSRLPKIWYMRQRYGSYIFRGGLFYNGIVLDSDNVTYPEALWNNKERRTTPCHIAKKPRLCTYLSNSKPKRNGQQSSYTLLSV